MDPTRGRRSSWGHLTTQSQTLDYTTPTSGLVQHALYRSLSSTFNVSCTMGATFTSLPPEVLLEILSHLPHPTRDTEPAVSSPLVYTATVNQQLRSLSQQLLFKSVTLSGKEQAERWIATDARKWTTELAVGVVLTGPTDVSVWPQRVLEFGLVGKDGEGGRSLKVLALDPWVQEELSEEWYRADGLKGQLSQLHQF